MESGTPPTGGQPPSAASKLTRRMLPFDAGGGGHRPQPSADIPPIAPELRALIQRVVDPLLAENARLIDRLRAQAEETGELRERLRQAEERGAVAGRDDRARARALRTLLEALQPE